MRRTTSNCSFVAQEQQKLLGRLKALDTQAIARALEQLVTTERAERLRSVFAARIDAVTVLMDAPHDPHNGAAVLRSCDAFGAQRMHVIERYESFLASNTVSRGSERWVEVLTHKGDDDALASLERSGHELVATHPKGELQPSDLGAIPKVALVLGNERWGINERLQERCKRSVRIPMRGFAESLNVSVTAAILLQYATAGRPGDLDERERDFLYARALVLTIPRASEILLAQGVDISLE